MTDAVIKTHGTSNKISTVGSGLEVVGEK